MERIQYSNILDKVEEVRRDPYVHKVLRMIGMEVSMQSMRGSLWFSNRYSQSDWRRAIQSRSPKRLISMITKYDGSDLSQMMLAYTVIKAAYPNLDIWLERDDDFMPMVRMEDFIIVPTSDSMSDIRGDVHNICDISDILSIFRNDNQRGVPYREDDLISRLGSVYRYGRVKSAVTNLYSSDLGDIYTLTSNLNIDDYLEDLIRRSVSLHRLVYTYTEILEELIPTGCRSQTAGIRYGYGGDIDFIF